MAGIHTDLSSWEIHGLRRCTTEIGVIVPDCGRMILRNKLDGPKLTMAYSSWHSTCSWRDLKQHNLLYTKTLLTPISGRSHKDPSGWTSRSTIQSNRSCTSLLKLSAPDWVHTLALQTTGLTSSWMIQEAIKLVTLVTLDGCSSTRLLVLVLFGTMSLTQAHTHSKWLTGTTSMELKILSSLFKFTRVSLPS